MKKSLFLGALLSASVLFSQHDNLIENGSFESTNGKIKGLGAIESTTTWFSPTANKADLFVKESKVETILTSGNIYGKEDPKHGQNYAGIVGYSYNDKVPRSYLTTTLSKPLVKGLKYCFSMHINLAEASKYASNQIGAHFSKKGLESEDKKALINASHILHSQKKIVNAMYGWEKICGTYIAEGGEKYITIGNFSTNESTQNEKTLKNTAFKGVPTIASYYFIDDVQLFLIDPAHNCDCGEQAATTSTTNSESFYHKVILLEDKMTSIEKIEAHTVFFPFGKSTIQEAITSHLNIVIAELKKNPSYKIELYGHLDTKEQEYSAKKPAFADLTKFRVKAVAEYLISKGIEASRIISSPASKSEPNENSSETDDEDLKMAKDRRVMFKVREN